MHYKTDCLQMTDQQAIRYLSRMYHAQGGALRDRLGVGKWDYGAFDDVDKLLLAHSVTETLKAKQMCEGFKRRLLDKTAKQQARLHPDSGFMP